MKGTGKNMTGQKTLSSRIDYYCRLQQISYYELAFRSAVPLPTLMHILDGSTRNPGVFTIVKLFNGFGIAASEFFDTKEFEEIDFDAQ